MSISILHNLISSLKLIEQKPEDPNYFEKFHNVVCQIGNLKDPNSISLLVQFLRDESQEEDLMFAIIHTIEIFDDDIYIEKILKICPYLYKNSPKWTSIIFMRIINSDTSKVELIRQLRQSSSTIKAIVKDIIEKINERSSTFIAKTTSVLLATSIFK